MEEAHDQNPIQQTRTSALKCLPWINADPQRALGIYCNF